MPLALSLIALVQPASLQPRITENVSMLCAPGSTDKIADHLAHEGIRGNIDSADGCPLSIYLSDRVGVHIDVSTYSLAVACPDGVVWLNSPVLFHAFVKAFDSGAFRWLELVPCQATFALKAALETPRRRRFEATANSHGVPDGFAERPCDWKGEIVFRSKRDPSGDVPLSGGCSPHRVGQRWRDHDAIRAGCATSSTGSGRLSRAMEPSGR
jgi:hypothetical protein